MRVIAAACNPNCHLITHVNCLGGPDGIVGRAAPRYVSPAAARKDNVLTVIVCALNRGI
jgi:hypothetical protein